MVHKTEVDTSSHGNKHCLKCRREAFKIHFDWYCTCQGMSFEDWFNYGVANGYCSDQFCSTHDVAPMHETEEQEWQQGGDPCMHVIRLGCSEDWQCQSTPGQVPEWPNGTGCKPVGLAYGGSNPSLPTKALMAEQADAPALGAGLLTGGGSSPPQGTEEA